MLQAGDLLGMRISGETPVVVLEHLVCNNTDVFQTTDDVTAGYTYEVQGRTCVDVVVQLLYESG